MTKTFHDMDGDEGHLHDGHDDATSLAMSLNHVINMAKHLSRLVLRQSGDPPWPKPSYIHPLYLYYSPLVTPPTC